MTLSNSSQRETSWEECWSGGPSWASVVAEARTSSPCAGSRPIGGPDGRRVGLAGQSTPTDGGPWWSPAAAWLLTDEEIAATFCRMFALQPGTVPIFLNLIVPDRALTAAF